MKNDETHSYDNPFYVKAMDEAYKRVGTKYGYKWVSYGFGLGAWEKADLQYPLPPNTGEEVES